MPAVVEKSQKKPTNVSVRADLLAEAKALGLNLSRTLEAAIEQAIREKRRQQWLDDNHKALEAYSRHIEKDGLFADRFRSF
jgi:antitoxin CcdA